MATLYELAPELRVLLNHIEAEGGELEDDQITRAFEKLDGDFTEKIGRMIEMIREVDALAKARSSEADRLRSRARTGEKTIGRLRAYILDAMRVSGIKRVDTGNFLVWRAKNSKPNLIYRKEDLPEEYVIKIEREEVDTEGLREFLIVAEEAEEECKFASLEYSDHLCMK